MTSFQNSVIKIGNSFFQVEDNNVYSNGDVVLSANISPENKVEMGISIILHFMYNLQVKLIKFIKSFKKTKPMPDREELEDMLYKSTRDRLLRILNDEDIDSEDEKCESLNKNELKKYSQSKNSFLKKIYFTKLINKISVFNKLILKNLKLYKFSFNFKYIRFKYG